MGMLNAFLSDAARGFAPSGAHNNHTTSNAKLHRIASEPYSVQARRMQEISRTLSDSTGTTTTRSHTLEYADAHTSTYRSYTADEAPDGITCHGNGISRRSSLRKVHHRDGGACANGGHGGRGVTGPTPRKKTVSWMDEKIPGRSISEFHLITPRSMVSERYYEQQQQAQQQQQRGRSPQYQYYYYANHYFNSKSPRSTNACGSCMSTIRNFWWGC
mmetsp:Transcript_31671/g.68535  ORF Transcript_31671/g.68535 Transcript_31671/m.68535 type:complete len:216 (+) Transcript_31671:286-933(+)